MHVRNDTHGTTENKGDCEEVHLRYYWTLRVIPGDSSTSRKKDANWATACIMQTPNRRPPGRIRGDYMPISCV